jgi:hypothetical protein
MELNFAHHKINSRLSQSPEADKGASISPIAKCKINFSCLHQDGCTIHAVGTHQFAALYDHIICIIKAVGIIN